MNFREVPVSISPDLAPPPTGPAQPPSQLTPVMASQPSTDGLPASLKGLLDQKFADPRLTPEQKEQALKVIRGLLEEDPKTEVFLGNSLKAGGVAFLAKLDGMPVEYQQKIISRVSCGKLYFESLNRTLDAWISDGRNLEDLLDFLRGVDRLQNADQVSRLISSGGILAVVQAAGLPAVSQGAGASSPTAAARVTAPTTTQTGSIFSLNTPLPDFFALSNSTSKTAPQVLVAEALIDFAKRCLEETRKQKEEQGVTTSIYSFGSPSTLRDLQQALQIVSARYGGPGDMARALSKLPAIQTAFRSDIVGSNITAEEIESSLHSLITSWKGQIRPPEDQPFPATGSTPPTNQPQTYRSPQSEPPATSLVSFGRQGTSSHPA